MWNFSEVIDVAVHIAKKQYWLLILKLILQNFLLIVEVEVDIEELFFYY